MRIASGSSCKNIYIYIYLVLFVTLILVGNIVSYRWLVSVSHKQIPLYNCLAKSLRIFLFNLILFLIHSFFNSFHSFVRFTAFLLLFLFFVAVMLFFHYSSHIFSSLSLSLLRSWSMEISLLNNGISVDSHYLAFKAISLSLFLLLSFSL